MEHRLHWLQTVVLIAFGLLGLRLIDLQLIRGGHYRQLAEQNRLRLVPEFAPRGLIVDRQGRVLAANQTVFRVAVVPQEADDISDVLAHLSPVVHRSVDVLQKDFRRERSLSFMPATIVSRVPKEIAIQLEEERWRLPGLLVKPEPLRDYPLGSIASHLLGYLGQPTAEEFPLLKQYGVHPKQFVGRMGLEQLLDDALRGQSGGLMVEVNHQARQVRVIGRRPPSAGARVVLTIDAQLQSLIETAFGAQPGAAVVLNPQTGEVLAMVSVPAFSPEAFASSDAVAVRRFLADPQSSLMNRAALGVYQPGSILKLVTAGAALEHHLITPQTTLVCPGSITIGDRTFHCWNRDGHGPMTLSEALMQSCNVYFMQVAMKLGPERLRAALEQMGFSHRTGWPLEEQAGHLPQRRLTKGDVAQLGIGQGEVLVTVLQCAVMASAFANNGWLVEPWVVETVAGQPTAHRNVRRRLGWSTQTLDAVRAGMVAVVRDPAGTGHRAFSSIVTIAGKTGTAQTHVPGMTHGWFVGFCPVEPHGQGPWGGIPPAPAIVTGGPGSEGPAADGRGLNRGIEQLQVAMAIVAEHGGSGGELPAEIAKSVCEYVQVAERAP